MRSMTSIKKLLSVTLICSLISIIALGSAVTVFAKESKVTTDSVGNAFIAGEAEEITSGDYFAIFGAGRDLTVSGVTAEDSLALAGMNVNLKDSSIGSSAFLAGMNVVVSDADISGNIVAAASSVTIEGDTKARALIATGGELTLDGTIDAAYISASKVTINGTINGDASIVATSVELGPNAVVKGKLEVEASNAPTISDQASVEKLDFELVPASAATEKNFGEKAADWIKSVIYWIVAMSIVGLIIFWLFRAGIYEAADMVKERPAFVIGTGAVTLIATPLVAVISCITVIGIPLGVIIIVLYTLALFIAVAFTGASLGTLFFKKMPALPAALLGIAILEIALKIPFLGSIVGIACFLYTLGYFVQAIWTKRNIAVTEEKDIVDIIAEVPLIEEKESEE